MAKKQTKRSKTISQETDSAFFLKLVLYMIVGSQWLRITDNETLQIPIPIGLIVGMFFIVHDHFQIDRKIEYAVLLVAMFISYWLPMGINLVI